MELVEKWAPPAEEDKEWYCSRVEHYKCKVCDQKERFARYNHPLKLFETRVGRCGEWGKAFTCLCAALGYDVRVCIDWTDHCWTEVYIKEYQRWVHMDSCENIIDKPLTYEKGWGK